MDAVLKSGCGLGGTAATCLPLPCGWRGWRRREIIGSNKAYNGKAGAEHESCGPGGAQKGKILPRRVKAIYQKGAFLLEEPYDLPEGSRVALAIEGSILLPPGTSAPEEKRRIRKTLVERMRANPIPTGAPRLTRDVLHDRG